MPPLLLLWVWVVRGLGLLVVGMLIQRDQLVPELAFARSTTSTSPSCLLWCCSLGLLLLALVLLQIPLLLLPLLPTCAPDGSDERFASGRALLLPF